MTLKEIAKLAGVSSATVSYVLNNSAPVSEITRKRVLKIVEKPGYPSNIIARSLHVNKTRTVGIIVEDVTVPHTAAIIDGINEYAKHNAYNTVLSNLRLMSKSTTAATGTAKRRCAAASGISSCRFPVTARGTMRGIIHSQLEIYFGDRTTL